MRTPMHRREFLRRSLAVTAGSTVGLAAFPHLLAAPGSANNQVRIAVAGVRSQGNGLANVFQGLPNVDVVALCEPDERILDQRLSEMRKRRNLEDNGDLRGYRDIRPLLERKDIDAVVIAAPNHWHSLMTIWACQAGKHVYVEKPVSHSIWEGRKMVEAARKYNRVVQAGTQQRSCPAIQECARDLQAGRWGKVQWVHCSKLDARGTIGKVTSPQPVPDHIDYNLWAGPAPMTPVMRRQFHYDWHWQWNWGDGEMGNWGIHYIDDFRCLLGWKDVPTKVIAAGNRFLWDDNGETPNMHFALFDYDGVPVVVDIRNLPDPERGGDRGAVYLGSRGGNYIQCEAGHISIARGGGWAFDRDGNRVHQYKGDGGRGHAPNFISALRNGNPKELNADIEVCHLSTVVCHQANLAWRVGAKATVDQTRAVMKQHPDALNTLNDMLEQLHDNQVDLEKTPLMLSAELTYNRRQERFTGTGAAEANRHVRLPYRPGFEISDQV